jgi:hypothetical protein
LNLSKYVFLLFEENERLEEKVEEQKQVEHKNSKEKSVQSDRTPYCCVHVGCQLFGMCIFITYSII